MVAHTAPSELAWALLPSTKTVIPLLTVSQSHRAGKGGLFLRQSILSWGISGDRETFFYYVPHKSD